MTTEAPEVSDVIDNNDIERLKEIFVTRRECDEKQDEVKKEVTDAEKNIALMQKDIASIKFVAKATLTSSIGVLVAEILTRILGG